MLNINRVRGDKNEPGNLKDFLDKSMDRSKSRDLNRS